MFKVGFQLSYLAVFFILWAQPMFYSLYRPRFYLDRMLWGIISVSLAAQLGILPVSLYYFHRFPGLFLITNSVVLPFLGLLLGGGFLIVILALLKILPDFISNAYWILIELLNGFIEWVSSHETFIIENIHYSAEKMLFSYFFIIALVAVFKTTHYRNLMICLTSLILLIGVYIFNGVDNSKNELVIFHKAGQTNIGILDAKKFYLFRSDPFNKSTFDQFIQPYMTSRNIRNHKTNDLPDVFYFKDRLVCVLDSSGVYPKDREMNWILLTNNSRINLERMISQTDPDLVIADGSNWNSNLGRWKVTCRKNGIPFYSTSESGAFISNE
jgi:competence protein ComEC